MCKRWWIATSAITCIVHVIVIIFKCTLLPGDLDLHSCFSDIVIIICGKVCFFAAMIAVIAKHCIEIVLCKLFEHTLRLMTLSYILSYSDFYIIQ